MCVTDRHDMNLPVKVALNPNTTNQPTKQNAIELKSYLLKVRKLLLASKEKKMIFKNQLENKQS